VETARCWSDCELSRLAASSAIALGMAGRDGAVELAEGSAESQKGRMLLTAFPRLSCGCPVRAALLLQWDTVGLLAVNNYSKDIILFIIVLK
jgi:hypothetical protein